MESLLATYAQSDDEDNKTESDEDGDREPDIYTNATPSSSPPSSSSCPSSSLPFPKQGPELFHETSSYSQKKNKGETGYGNTGLSSLFSSLPQPKQSNPSPILPSMNPRWGPVSYEEEQGEEDKDLKRNYKVPNPILSVNSFLSSMPPPKKSSNLCFLPSLGSGRTSVFEVDLKSSAVVVDDRNPSNMSGHSVDLSDSGQFLSNQASSEIMVDGGGDHVTSGSAIGNHGDFTNFGDFFLTDHHKVSSSSVMAEFDVPQHLPISGKRVRNEVPVNIIEVNQDDLMKNRPRDDQSKLNGIAFGPSYQATPSTRGKPSKLQKRKHQIGSLYHDMRQKEMELSERRARGFLTKAETQAKYGW